MITVLSLAALAPASVATTTHVSPPANAAHGVSINDAIHEASLRFAVPEIWIRAVISAESGGNAAAVSPKGAMGLMQLMPASWQELRQKHGLGEDVFDTRDNILAGTAYLRFLFDRFGMEGFIAAYNAGPKRYEAYLKNGKTLPLETRVYVQRVRQRLGAGLITATSPSSPTPVLPWSSAPLFASPTPEAPEAASDTLAPPPGPFVDLRPTPSLPLK